MEATTQQSPSELDLRSFRREEDPVSRFLELLQLQNPIAIKDACSLLFQELARQGTIAQLDLTRSVIVRLFKLSPDSVEILGAFKFMLQYAPTKFAAPEVQSSAKPSSSHEMRQDKDRADPFSMIFQLLRRLFELGPRIQHIDACLDKLASTLFSQHLVDLKGSFDKFSHTVIAHVWNFFVAVAGRNSEMMRLVIRRYSVVNGATHKLLSENSVSDAPSEVSVREGHIRTPLSRFVAMVMRSNDVNLISEFAQHDLCNFCLDSMSSVDFPVLQDAIAALYENAVTSSPLPLSVRRSLFAVRRIKSFSHGLRYGGKFAALILEFLSAILLPAEGHPELIMESTPQCDAYVYPTYTEGESQQTKSLLEMVQRIINVESGDSISLAARFLVRHPYILQATTSDFLIDRTATDTALALRVSGFIRYMQDAPLPSFRELPPLSALPSLSQAMCEGKPVAETFAKLLQAAAPAFSSAAAGASSASSLSPLFSSLRQLFPPTSPSGFVDLGCPAAVPSVVIDSFVYRNETLKTVQGMQISLSFLLRVERCVKLLDSHIQSIQDYLNHFFASASASPASSSSSVVLSSSPSFIATNIVMSSWTKYRKEVTSLIKSRVPVNLASLLPLKFVLFPGLKPSDAALEASRDAKGMMDHVETKEAALTKQIAALGDAKDKQTELSDLQRKLRNLKTTKKKFMKQDKADSRSNFLLLKVSKESEHIPSPTADVLLTLFFRSVAAYQRLFPQEFLTKFEDNTIAIYSQNMAELPSTCLPHLLDVLSAHIPIASDATQFLEPLGEGTSPSLFWHMCNMAKNSADSTTASMARYLASKILQRTGLFMTCPSEVEDWIEALRMPSTAAAEHSEEFTFFTSCLLEALPMTASLDTDVRKSIKEVSSSLTISPQSILAGSTFDNGSFSAFLFFLTTRKLSSYTAPIASYMTRVLAHVFSRSKNRLPLLSLLRSAAPSFVSSCDAVSSLISFLERPSLSTVYPSASSANPDHISLCQELDEVVALAADTQGGDAAVSELLCSSFNGLPSQAVPDATLSKLSKAPESLTALQFPILLHFLMSSNSLEQPSSFALFSASVSRMSLQQLCKAAEVIASHLCSLCLATVQPLSSVMSDKKSSQAIQKMRTDFLANADNQKRIKMRFSLFFGILCAIADRSNKESKKLKDLSDKHLKPEVGVLSVREASIVLHGKTELPAPSSDTVFACTHLFKDFVSSQSSRLATALLQDPLFNSLCSLYGPDHSDFDFFAFSAFSKFIASIGSQSALRTHTAPLFNQYIERVSASLISLLAADSSNVDAYEPCLEALMLWKSFLSSSVRTSVAAALLQNIAERTPESDLSIEAFLEIISASDSAQSTIASLLASNALKLHQAIALRTKLQDQPTASLDSIIHLALNIKSNNRVSSSSARVVVDHADASKPEFIATYLSQVSSTSLSTPARMVSFSDLMVQLAMPSCGFSLSAGLCRFLSSTSSAHLITLALPSLVLLSRSPLLSPMVVSIFASSPLSSVLDTCLLASNPADLSARLQSSCQIPPSVSALLSEKVFLSCARTLASFFLSSPVSSSPRTHITKLLVSMLFSSSSSSSKSDKVISKLVSLSAPSSTKSKDLSSNLKKTFEIPAHCQSLDTIISLTNSLMQQQEANALHEINDAGVSLPSFAITTVTMIRCMQVIIDEGKQLKKAEASRSGVVVDGEAEQTPTLPLLLSSRVSQAAAAFISSVFSAQSFASSRSLLMRCASPIVTSFIQLCLSYAPQSLACCKLIYSVLPILMSYQQQQQYLPSDDLSLPQLLLSLVSSKSEFLTSLCGVSSSAASIEEQEEEQDHEMEEARDSELSKSVKSLLELSLSTNAPAVAPVTKLTQSHRTSLIQVLHAILLHANATASLFEPTSHKTLVAFLRAAVLSAYSATLSEDDMRLYDLIVLFEQQEIGFLASVGVVFGHLAASRLSAALSVASFDAMEEEEVGLGQGKEEEKAEEKDKKEPVHAKGTWLQAQETGLLTVHQLMRTSEVFPVELFVTKKSWHYSDASSTWIPYRDEMVDPRFALLLFTAATINTSASYVELAAQAVRSGFASLAFAATASMDVVVREYAYDALMELSAVLKNRRDGPNIACFALLTAFRNGVRDKYQRIATPVASFMAQAILLPMRPSSAQFVPVFTAVLRGRISDLEMPLFNHVTASNTSTTSERVFLIRLLSCGLRTREDRDKYIRWKAMPYLLTHFLSPDSFNPAERTPERSRMDILRGLNRSIRNRLAAIHLINDCGFLTWLEHALFQPINAGDESISMEILNLVPEACRMTCQTGAIREGRGHEFSPLFASISCLALFISNIMIATNGWSMSSNLLLAAAKALDSCISALDVVRRSTASSSLSSDSFPSLQTLSVMATMASDLASKEHSQRFHNSRDHALDAQTRSLLLDCIIRCPLSASSPSFSPAPASAASSPPSSSLSEVLQRVTSLVENKKDVVPLSPPNQLELTTVETIVDNLLAPASPSQWNALAVFDSRCTFALKKDASDFAPAPPSVAPSSAAVTASDKDKDISRDDDAMEEDEEDDDGKKSASASSSFPAAAAAAAAEKKKIYTLLEGVPVRPHATTLSVALSWISNNMKLSPSLVSQISQSPALVSKILSLHGSLSTQSFADQESTLQPVCEILLRILQSRGQICTSRSRTIESVCDSPSSSDCAASLQVCCLFMIHQLASSSSPSSNVTLEPIKQAVRSSSEALSKLVAELQSPASADSMGKVESKEDKKKRRREKEEKAAAADMEDDQAVVESEKKSKRDKKRSKKSEE